MKNKTILLLIILLAFFLRFFMLGKNPPSLYWDEASLGYNAYSILKTGRDEFGEKFPLDKFIAFGDYKPVGYIYAVVPSIALFGLNEFAIRFPSALSGVLMVLLTYYLVKELFNKEKLALISAFLLAVSPWSLHLSRVAFEANFAAFLNLLSVYFFIKGAKEKGYYLLFSMICFAGTFYTFNSNRVLMPLLFLVLSLVYIKDLWKKKQWLVGSLIVIFIILLPLVPYLKSKESRLRFHEVNIFSNLDVVIQANQRIAASGGTRLAKLAYHRFFGHASNFLKHYFDHFSGEFLFISGDVNPRLSVRNVGELYLIELPFFLIGLYLLLTNLKKKPYLLILLWFLLAPIPAATARETPHALRIVSILPTPQIISALGILFIFNYFRKFKYFSLFLITYSLFFVLSFSYYLYSYYFVFPKLYADQWLDGYKQAIEYINKNKNKYDKIYITNHYSRPYIYLLFFQNYSPAKYNELVDRERDWYGNWSVKSFDKYIFGDEVGDFSKILYLTKPGTNKEGFNKIGEINNNFAQPVFWVLER